MITVNEHLVAKWKSVLDHPSYRTIKDPWRRGCTAQILESTMIAVRNEAQEMRQQILGEAAIPTNFMGASGSDASAGAIDTFDPVLISMLRRSVPNLIAYELCGVQPMTGPTGLIFAMRVRERDQANTEAWYDEVNTALSTIPLGNSTVNSPGFRNVGVLPGNITQTTNLASTNTYNWAAAMATAQLEALGTTDNTAFAEMAFSIEKVTATAKGRALRATYSLELAQDLKAVHGLDAESVLSEMLTAEILAEINREIVRTINVTAKRGSTTDTTTAGIFDLDVDANGRWSVEKFKGMHFHIERECNQIAKDTRRGKGNFMLCTSDVASALQAAKVLDYTPDMASSLGVDDTGNTFAGLIGNRIKVYIDPYASGGQYMTVGYKGATPMDAGLFYCPYVPLQQVRAVDPTSYQPSFGFKTRYAVVANPFAEGTTVGAGALTKDSNVYYRRSIITHLM